MTAHKAYRMTMGAWKDTREHGAVLGGVAGGGRLGGRQEPVGPRMPDYPPDAPPTATRENVSAERGTQGINPSAGFSRTVNFENATRDRTV